MKVSKLGIDLIKSFEGFRSKPYNDGVGVITIGYGTTFYPNGKSVMRTDEPITKDTALKHLVNNMSGFERQLNGFIKVDITQNQYDALLSFCYNLGVTALRKSTLLRKININPSDATIRNEFMKYVNAGGKRMDGLVKRRGLEADLYFKQK